MITSSNFSYIQQFYFSFFLFIIFVFCLHGEESASKKLENIEKRLNKLENAPKNRLVPADDIEFLYDVVVKGDYKFTPPIILDRDTKVLGIHDEGFFGNWVVQIKDNDKQYDSKTNVNDYKLLAVEHTLKLKTDTNTSELIPRIDKIYEEINYKNWDEDRIRFAVFTNYVPQLKSIVYSAGIMTFPSYKKYKPGRVDLLRRYAPYISVGTSANSDEVEINGNIFTFGVNFEVQDGFGINCGYSIYDYRTDKNAAFGHGESVSYGVTLSSDLWKRLFL